MNFYEIFVILVTISCCCECASIKSTENFDDQSLEELKKLKHIKDKTIDTDDFNKGGNQIESDHLEVIENKKPNLLKIEDTPTEESNKEKRCKTDDALLGTRHNIAASLPLFRRDTTTNYYKKGCENCRNSVTCKTRGKCENCKKVCDKYEEAKSYQEDQKQDQHQELKEEIHTDNIGMASRIANPEETNILGKEGGLSDISDRYYSVGAFEPGPIHDLLVKLLRINHTNNIEELLILAKPKSKVRQKSVHPVVIDTAHIFTLNKGKPSLLNVEIHHVDDFKGEANAIASKVDKEIQKAFEEKRKGTGYPYLGREEIDDAIEKALDESSASDDSDDSEKNNKKQLPEQNANVNDTVACIDKKYDDSDSNSYSEESIYSPYGSYLYRSAENDDENQGAEITQSQEDRFPIDVSSRTSDQNQSKNQQSDTNNRLDPSKMTRKAEKLMMEFPKKDTFGNVPSPTSSEIRDFKQHLPSNQRSSPFSLDDAEDEEEPTRLEQKSPIHPHSAIVTEKPKSIMTHPKAPQVTPHQNVDNKDNEKKIDEIKINENSEEDSDQNSKPKRPPILPKGETGIDEIKSSSDEKGPKEDEILEPGQEPLHQPTVSPIPEQTPKHMRRPIVLKDKLVAGERASTQDTVGDTKQQPGNKNAEEWEELDTLGDPMLKKQLYEEKYNKLMRWVQDNMRSATSSVAESADRNKNHMTSAIKDVIQEAKQSANKINDKIANLVEETGSKNANLMKSSEDSLNADDTPTEHIVKLPHMNEFKTRFSPETQRKLDNIFETDRLRTPPIARFQNKKLYETHPRTTSEYFNGKWSSRKATPMKPPYMSKHEPMLNLLGSQQMENMVMDSGEMEKQKTPPFIDSKLLDMDSLVDSLREVSQTSPDQTPVLKHMKQSSLEMEKKHLQEAKQDAEKLLPKLSVRSDGENNNEKSHRKTESLSEIENSAMMGDDPSKIMEEKTDMISKLPKERLMSSENLRKESKTNPSSVKEQFQEPHMQHEGLNEAGPMMEDNLTKDLKQKPHISTERMTMQNNEDKISKDGETVACSKEDDEYDHDYYGKDKIYKIMHYMPSYGSGGYRASKNNGEHHHSPIISDLLHPHHPKSEIETSENTLHDSKSKATTESTHELIESLNKMHKHGKTQTQIKEPNDEMQQKETPKKGMENIQEINDKKELYDVQNIQNDAASFPQQYEDQPMENDQRPYLPEETNQRFASWLNNPSMTRINQEFRENDEMNNPNFMEEVPPMIEEGMLGSPVMEDAAKLMDYSHLGKFIPRNGADHIVSVHTRDVSDQKKHRNMYFVGDGIRLPLNMKEHHDGSMHLSVDMKSLCNCKHCASKRLGNGTVILEENPKETEHHNHEAKFEIQNSNKLEDTQKDTSEEKNQLKQDSSHDNMKFSKNEEINRIFNKDDNLEIEDLDDLPMKETKDRMNVSKRSTRTKHSLRDNEIDSELPSMSIEEEELVIPLKMISKDKIMNRISKDEKDIVRNNYLEKRFENLNENAEKYFNPKIKLFSNVLDFMKKIAMDVQST